MGAAPLLGAGVCGMNRLDTGRMCWEQAHLDGPGMSFAKKIGAPRELVISAGERHIINCVSFVYQTIKLAALTLTTGDIPARGDCSIFPFPSQHQQSNNCSGNRQRVGDFGPLHFGIVTPLLTEEGQVESKM